MKLNKLIVSIFLLTSTLGSTNVYANGAIKSAVGAIIAGVSGYAAGSSLRSGYRAGDPVTATIFNLDYEGEITRLGDANWCPYDSTTYGYWFKSNDGTVWMQICESQIK